MYFSAVKLEAETDLYDLYVCFRGTYACYAVVAV